MKLGIFGGTFNPLHYAHLILAQEAYEQLGLDSVLFVPTWQPPYKTTISYEHRIAMTCRATVDDPRFQVSAIEEQRRVSYTVEMLDALREERPGNERHLILGGDQAGEFFTWKHPDSILAIVKRVVCVERDSYGRGRILDHWGDYAHRLNFLDVPPLYPSSTLVRAKVVEGESIRYLVPPEVEEYIYAEGLYAVGDGRKIEDGAATSR